MWQNHTFIQRCKATKTMLAEKKGRGIGNKIQKKEESKQYREVVMGGGGNKYTLHKKIYIYMYVCIQLHISYRHGFWHIYFNKPSAFSCMFV